MFPTMILQFHNTAWDYILGTRRCSHSTPEDAPGLCQGDPSVGPPVDTPVSDCWIKEAILQDYKEVLEYTEWLNELLG